MLHWGGGCDGKCDAAALDTSLMRKEDEIIMSSADLVRRGDDQLNPLRGRRS